MAVKCFDQIVDDLEQSGSRPEWCEATRKELKEGNCYLKKEYRAHCRENKSPFPDHCTRYAISDPQSTHFQASCVHEHCAKCHLCETLKNAMMFILSDIASPEISLYGNEQKRRPAVRCQTGTGYGASMEVACSSGRESRPS